jgi:hypothetical protein
LQKLKEQQAIEGISVDPKILIEIEDIYFKRLRFGLFQRTENSRITRFPIQLCVLDERFG